jgi:hypothetical protein
MVQLADDFQPIQTRHGDIDDRDIGIFLTSLMYGLLAIGRLRDNLHFAAFFDKAPKSGTHDPVIICQ